MLEKCIKNISEEDLELLYIYDDDSILELAVSLKERGVNIELIRSVFGNEKKDLREKE